MRWLLVLVTGCFSPAPPAGAPCGDPPTCPRNLTCIGGFCLEPGSTTDALTDGPADMAVTPPDACKNFATQLDTCTVTPGAALVLAGSYDYDTDSQTLVQLGGAVIPTTSTVINGMAGPVIAIVTESFTLTSGKLRVVGEVPFGIVAFGDISIGGLIDASAGGAGRRGNALCMDNVGRNGTTDGDGSSGAGGGGFQGAGGDGGEGDENRGRWFLLATVARPPRSRQVRSVVVEAAPVAVEPGSRASPVRAAVRCIWSPENASPSPARSTRAVAAGFAPALPMAAVAAVAPVG